MLAAHVSSFIVCSNLDLTLRGMWHNMHCGDWPERFVLGLGYVITSIANHQSPTHDKLSRFLCFHELTMLRALRAIVN